MVLLVFFSLQTIYCPIKYIKKRTTILRMQSTVDTNYSKLKSIIHFSLWPNVLFCECCDKRWKNNQQTENTTQLQQFIGVWFSSIAHYETTFKATTTTTNPFWLIFCCSTFVLHSLTLSPKINFLPFTALWNDKWPRHSVPCFVYSRFDCNLVCKRFV